MRIGVDLGGSKIELIALGANGAALARQRAPTPMSGYEACIDAISGLIRQVETQTGRNGSVGIGIPGAVSRATGLIKNANSTWLNGKPFEHDIAQALARPVRIANDADCFALSEATDGAAMGAHCVFGVIAGTGCGGGLVINGKLLAGPNAITGEWGHNSLPWPKGGETPGPLCYCGKRGCIETFLSGPGFSARHFEQHGEKLSPQEIAANARSGDRRALASLDLYTDRMARAIASIINIIDPDVIVLGGGLSNMEALYHMVPQRWNDYVFSDRVDTRLVRNQHGDSSGVRGAAWLWPER